MFKKYFLRFIFALMIISLLTPSIPATAMTDEQKDLYIRNILYYDLTCEGSEAADEPSNIESVYMIGDSITRGAIDGYKLKEKFKEKEIDAKFNATGAASLTYGGDPSAGTGMSGLEAIESDKDIIKDSDAVVIAHGTNQIVSELGPNIKKAIDAVREINEDAQIFWVNTDTDSPILTDYEASASAEKNKIIEEKSEELEFTVIDIPGANIPLSSDGIHPEFAESGHGKWGDTVVEGVSTATSSSPDDETSSDASASLDLEELAKKFNLISVAVTKIDGSEVDSYQADEVPESVASIIKLVIADAFLKTKPDLNKKVTIKSKHLYGGATPSGKPWDPKAGQEFTLKQSLEYALKNSSNTHANVLIDEAGGPNKITQMAKSMGYSATDITSYFKDTNSSSNPRKSTANDLAKAMSNIFSAKDEGHKIAQAALKGSTYNFGLDSIANKWGGSSSFTGNSGVFDVSGEEYIITMLSDEKWQDEVLPDYPGTRGTDPSPSVNKIKQATTQILDSLQGAQEVLEEGCACSVDASALEGENDAVTVYNYLIENTDLEPAQVSGIIGNLMRETGGDGYDFDPESVSDPSMCTGGSCRGIAQWSGTRWAKLDAWAQKEGKTPTDLLTQAEYIKVELESDYTTTLNNLKAIKGDDEDAAYAAGVEFNETFEIGVGTEQRAANAARFFKEYVTGGGDLSGGPPDSNGGCSDGSGASTGELEWPDDGRKDPITSCFGARSSPGGVGSTDHGGIDIGSPTGANVTAADGGVVEIAGDAGGFGNTVVIKHGNDLWTLYAHNTSLNVKVGDKVDQGDVIGKVGMTGAVTGPHIHFNVQTAGGADYNNVVDPLEHLPDDGREVMGSNC